MAGLDNVSSNLNDSVTVSEELCDTDTEQVPEQSHIPNFSQSLPCTMGTMGTLFLNPSATLSPIWKHKEQVMLFFYFFFLSFSFLLLGDACHRFEMS